MTSLRATLARSLIVPTMFGLGGLGAIVLTEYQPEQVAPAASDGPSRVERLIERHDCYTGTNPHPDAIPGGAVVTTVDDGTRFVASSVGFDIYQGKTEGVLHAFCERGPR